MVAERIFAFFFLTAYAPFMSSAPNVRRSMRVPIKVAIEVEGCTEPLRCEGVTVVVNLHGTKLTSVRSELQDAFRLATMLPEPMRNKLASVIVDVQDLLHEFD
jgi:hypothetical protein